MLNENRLEKITSSLSEGFFIEQIVRDLNNLQKEGNHFLAKEEIPEYYLRLSDILIEKKRTYSDLSQTVIHLRKGEYNLLNKLQIETLLSHVKLLNNENLNQTQRAFYP